jgi:hypothetical protein
MRAGNVADIPGGRVKGVANGATKSIFQMKNIGLLDLNKI